MGESRERIRKIRVIRFIREIRVEGFLTLEQPCNFRVQFLTISVADDRLSLSNLLYERRHEKMKSILSSVKRVLSAPPMGES